MLNEIQQMQSALVAAQKFIARGRKSADPIED
jgi:hypothetical protein